MRPLAAQVGVRIASEALLALRGVLLIPVLARALGASGYGAFSQVFLTAQVLAPFINLSVENAVVQRVAGAGSPAGQGRALTNALLISPLLGLVCVAVALTPLGPAAARAVMGSPSLQWELLAALALAMLGGPISVGLGYLQGMQRIGAASTLHVSRSLGSTVIMIAAALAGAGLRGVILAAIVTDAAFLGGMLVALRRRIAWRDSSIRDMRMLAAFAVPFAAGNALYLALGAFPRFVLVHAAGLAAVAVFSAVVSLANPLLQAAGAVQFVMYPAAARQTQGEGIAAGAGLLARAAAGVVCVASFVIAGLCFLGPALLAALTGGRLVAPVSDFATVSYAMLCLGLYRVIVVYQVMTGHSKILMRPLALSAVVVAVSAFPLIGYAAGTGAALTFLLASVALLAGTSWQLRRSAFALAVGALSPLRSRAAIALALPLLALALPAAPSLVMACARTALALAAIAAVWLCVGGWSRLKLLAGTA